MGLASDLLIFILILGYDITAIIVSIIISVIVRAIHSVGTLSETLNLDGVSP